MGHGNGKVATASHLHPEGNLMRTKKVLVLFNHQHGHGNGEVATASHLHPEGNLMRTKKVLVLFNHQHGHGNGKVATASHLHPDLHPTTLHPDSENAPVKYLEDCERERER